MVGGALHHDVQVAGREAAAAVRRAKVRHGSSIRAVIPGHIDGVVGRDGDEWPVAPVLRVRRDELRDLRERRAVVEGRSDDRIPLRAVREHEDGVDGPIGADGDRGIPRVVVRASRVGDGDRRVERVAAVRRARERDPAAAHPCLVDVAERGVDGLFDLSVLARTRRAGLGGRADRVAGSGTGERRSRADEQERGTPDRRP